MSKSIGDFVTEHGLTLEAQPIAHRPDGLMDYGKRIIPSHFLCIIKNPAGILMTTYYSVGPGVVDAWIRKANPLGAGWGLSDKRRHWLRQPNTLYAQEYRNAVKDKFRPELADILDSLASDAVGLEATRDFEEWASEYGFDTDSRKAEAIYNATKANTRDLERVLGRVALQELISEVERL